MIVTVTETVIETATAGKFATVMIIADLIGVTLIGVTMIGVTMTAALIAMTGGVIGMIGVANGRCTGTDTAGFTNLVQ